MQGEALAAAHQRNQAPAPAVGAPAAVAPAPPAAGPGHLGAVPAAVIGGAVANPAAVGPDTWIAIEDGGGFKKGDVVAQDPNPLPYSLSLHDRGVIPVGGSSLLVRKVAQAEVHSYRLEDLRVLPVQFDRQGTRRRELNTSVSSMDDGEPLGGGLQLTGPPTTLRLMKELRDQSFTPSTFHEHWVRTTELPRGDRSVYEHECLSRILDSMACADQLNLPALQSAELICRRLQVIREAHRISPGQPDYSSADYFNMGWKY